MKRGRFRLLSMHTVHLFTRPEVKRRGYCFSPLIAFPLIVRPGAPRSRSWREWGMNKFVTVWLLKRETWSVRLSPLWKSHFTPALRSPLRWTDPYFDRDIRKSYIVHILIFHFVPFSSSFFQRWMRNARKHMWTYVQASLGLSSCPSVSLSLSLFDDGGISILWGLWAQRVCFCLCNPLALGASR